VTNGGDEYAGAVIARSLSELGWDDSRSTYKAVFIAGNEHFGQGPVSFHDSMKTAKARGVFVNTIYCGSRYSGKNDGWEEGARLAGGRYLSIDQDRQVAALRAPQDDEIERLGRSLNDTFVPMAAPEAKRSAKRQREADEGAGMLASAGAMVQRALYKAKGNYSQSAADWDIVTAEEEGRAVPTESLPAQVRGMSADERKEFVGKKAKERKKIQEKISKLESQRKDWIKKNEKSGSKADSLDKVMLEAVQQQAASQNYTFKQ